MARRSLLFSPGDRPEMLRKAPESGADGVIFDLEDAVGPSHKATAREEVRAVLGDPGFDPACEVCVRINPIDIAAADDIDALYGDGAKIRLDTILLPMVERAADVEALHRMLADYGVQPAVFAAVETATGVLNAPGIAGAEGTDALGFGGEDFATNIGATRTTEGTEVLHARQRLILAATAAGIDVHDTVFTDIDDLDGLREEVEFAIQLGFDGKPAIHPKQVPVINEAFTPSRDEIAWAQRVLEGRDTAEGRGVFTVDGEMIDAPLIARAERIVERARAADALRTTE